MGHRTPYGLAFSPTGELWEIEHGPRGGDELNLIEKGKNYGWPLVGYAPNYNGVPIPNPDTRPDLAKPAIYWVPVIAPGNLMFYRGTQTFPQWDGNGFIGGLGIDRSLASSLTERAAPSSPNVGSGQTYPRCSGSPRWLSVAAGRRQRRRANPCDTQVSAPRSARSRI